MNDDAILRGRRTDDGGRSDDSELLRQYSEEKSEAAFAELVRRQLDLVYSAALRRLGGDSHRAADVAQQVFTALARDAKKLSHHGVLTAWLYTATRNAAIDLIRSEQRRHTREQEASTVQNLFSSTPDADWERLRPVLDHVMDELSDADRTAVLLRFFEKRPFADIGAALGLSEDAARMRVERALGKLRALLMHRGVTSTEVALGAMLANQAVAAAPAGLAATVVSTASTGAAVASGSATAHFITIMSTTKVIVSVTGAIALLAIGTAVHEFTMARDAKAAAVSRNEEYAGLQRQLAKERQRTVEAETRLQAAEERLAAVSSRAAEAVASGRQTPGAKRGTAGGLVAAESAAADTKASPLEVLAVSPEYQQLALKIQRAGFPLTYGPLYRLLNLSPQQVTAFENLVADQSQNYMDMIAAARAQGVSATDQSLAALRKPVDSAFGKKLAALLGDDGAKQFSSYLKTVDARATVDTLAGNLYYTDTPLTLTQADQLTSIVAANTSSLKVNGVMVAQKETNWDAVMTQAQAVLAPPQLTTLQLLQEKARLLQQMSTLSAALLRGGTPPSAVAGKTPGG